MTTSGEQDKHAEKWDFVQNNVHSFRSVMPFSFFALWSVVMLKKEQFLEPKLS